MSARVDGLFDRRVGVDAVRVEHVHVVGVASASGSARASASGTCASRRRRRGRATCRSRPWSRGTARRGSVAGRCRARCRTSSRRRRRAGRSCWRGRCARSRGRRRGAGSRAARRGDARCRSSATARGRCGGEGCRWPRRAGRARRRSGSRRHRTARSGGGHRRRWAWECSRNGEGAIRLCHGIRSPVDSAAGRRGGAGVLRPARSISPRARARSSAAPRVRCADLVVGDMTRKRRHTAVRTRDELVASTNSRARRRVSATSSGVSMRSLATSRAPSITFLPRISSTSSIGTFDRWLSSEMVSMLERCSRGKDSSYWRHSEPSVAFSRCWP